MKVLQMTLPNVLMSPLEILELVKVANCYPNVSIAYRILLTMSVTVASAKRSFSKLKLLKSYLRSSMSQERLNDLAILCIEKNMLENIDVDTIINDFASRNARRKCFFMNICMLNLKLNVFISIVKNILFVKSNKNYHLQAFFLLCTLEL